MSLAKQTRPLVLVAGVCGDTTQATGEAALANQLGYDAALSVSPPCKARRTIT